MACLQTIKSSAAESAAPALDPVLVARLRATSRLAAGVVVLIACSVLAGWVFEIDEVKRILPGLVAMNPLTALCFLVAGLGLMAANARHPFTAPVCGAAVALAGALILLRYVAGIDLRIDRLLFSRTLGDNAMAPTTAFNFLLTGSALGLLRIQAGTRRGLPLAEALGFGAALFALFVLTGYFYGVEPLYRLRTFIAMALHTALAFLVLALGLLCAAPDRGLMARVTSAHAGGAILRRLLLPQVAVPFVLGWLILRGHRAGYFDPALGFSLFVLGAIVFVSVTTWRNTALLDLEDAERGGAEVRLREAHASLENTVRDRTAELTQAISGVSEGIRVLGTSASEILESSSGLAAAANQTAVSLAETTTATEEVRQTAHTATDRAESVANAARKTARISTAGRDATQVTVEGMQRIREEMRSLSERMTRLSEQGQAIGEIIAAVDEIAEQSNMLAVNAAIEAARAGEHGRGFAVVAEEVKYLAGQSRQATQQVRTILTDIQKATGGAVMTTEQATRAVESGVAAAAEAGKSIVSLAASVDEAAENATQIAATSQQQLLGVEQVARALGQIKEASVQNVDQARHLEGAARSLNKLGEHLKQIVEKHRT